MKKTQKIIVIGLDGGTWNIIKPLVKQGKLPAIEKLIKNGSCGELESSMPPVTSPAWKCYSTGKNPGKFGVYFWENIDVGKKRFIVNNSTSFKSKEIWDYLSDYGLVCGILGMPTTYPPKKVNGFMVSEFNPSNSGYANPNYLEKELSDLFSYVGEFSDYHGGDKNLIIKDRKKLIKQRFDASRYLFKKFNPDFCHITIFHIDNIQHFYWEDMEDKDSKYGKAIEEAWILIDNELKKLLEYFNYNLDDEVNKKSENIYIILMSDHGFTKTKSFFNINQWLIKKEYLVLNDTKSSLKVLLYSKISRSYLAVTTINKLNKIHLIKNILKNIQKKIWGNKLAEGIINWKKSKIIPFPWGLYINKNLIGDKEYEIFRNKVLNELKEIENPDNGNKLAKKIYKKEDIYSGKYISTAPDIIIGLNEGFMMPCQFKEKRLWYLPDEGGWSGTHKLHGIFCISGPGIKKKREINNAKIIDLAPTILHIMNVPIPDDMDGRVLTECFEEDSKLAKRKIVYHYISEKSKINDKIKSLKISKKL